MDGPTSASDGALGAADFGAWGFGSVPPPWDVFGCGAGWWASRPKFDHTTSSSTYPSPKVWEGELKELGGTMSKHCRSAD